MLAPIKRIELEFIPSNYTGFEYIIKLNMIRQKGLTGKLSLIRLDRYEVDDSDPFEEVSHQLRYMGNSVYMSTNIYMGGVDLDSISSDKKQINVTDTNISEFRFLLDYTTDPDKILVYRLTYFFRDEQYYTPAVISYKPIEESLLVETDNRYNATRHNHIYRGKHRSIEYNRNNRELISDIRNLTNKIDTNESEIENMLDTIDKLYSMMYNVEYKIGSLYE